MLQGREINLLFLSPAPGIDPGSAGVRLQCFAHRPRRPTSSNCIASTVCQGYFLTVMVYTVSQDIEQV